MANLESSRSRKWRSRSKLKLIALEPRMLFDGAAVATADAVMPEPVAPVAESSLAPVTAVEQQMSSVSEAVDTTSGTEATLAEQVVSESLATDPVEPSTVFDIATDEVTATFADAQLESQRLIVDFLSQPDAVEQLFNHFSGGLSEMTPEWRTSAEDFIAKVLSGELVVRVELQSHAEMEGLFGAFAAKGTDGQATIYLNEGWVASAATTEGIERVLIEEFGHFADYAINGSVDSKGDEGESFALDVLNASITTEESLRIAAEDDLHTLTIDGQVVQTEGASIAFAAVYQGTPSAASQEANLLANLQVFNGTNFNFTSTDPNAPYFSGNNVAGYLNYTDSSGVRQQIAGVISRLFKTGSKVEGVYFYYAGTTPTIGDEPIGVEKAYALVFNKSYFAAGGTYGTSSDPVDTALNSFIVPNSAPDAVNDVKEIVLSDAGAGSTSGNVLSNDTDANNDTLTVTSFSIAGQGGSFVIGTPYSISGVGAFTLSANGNYTFVATNGVSGVVPVITYTISDGNGGTDTATLAITVYPANRAPVAVDDYRSIQFVSGGTISGTVAAKTSLISNDSDPDNDVVTVTQASTGSVLSGTPSSITGGTTSLTTEANTYLSFQFDLSASQQNQIPQAGTLVSFSGDGVPAGATFKEISVSGSGTKRYTVEIQTTTPAYFTAGSTITITGVSGSLTVINPTNISNQYISLSDTEASALSVGTTLSGSGYSGTVQAITNVTGDRSIVQLSTAFTGNAPTDLSYTVPAEVTLTGTYGTLRINNSGEYTYTLTASSPPNGSVDSFSYKISDPDSATDTGVLNITILTSAVTPVAVTGTTVNEASGYVLFTVTGTSGQKVRLDLAESGVGAGYADLGADLVDSLQYYDGTNWQSYSDSTLTLGVSGKLFVRAALLQDKISESSELIPTESIRLNVINADDSVSSALSYIVDDGTGVLYNSDTFASGVPATAIGTLDDDRPLSVSSINVNEASPYAVFEVSGVVGQKIGGLSVTGATATLGSDFNSTLQYFDGSNWQSFVAGTTAIPVGGKLLVRVGVINDGLAINAGLYEGAETFVLNASNTGGTSYTGIAAIVDDGSGTIYKSTDGTEDLVAAKDRDSSVTVTSLGDVNEASTYAFFTVKGNAGVPLMLSVNNISSELELVAGATNEATIEYWNGAAWVLYTYNETTGTGDKPTPLNDLVDGEPSGSGTFTVRVKIVSESDSIYEPSETFELVATTIATGTTLTQSSSATTAIKDDGNGKIFNAADGSENTDAVKDDDRALSVNSFSVNEGSPYAVFTVSGVAGQLTTLSLSNVTTTGLSGLEYYDPTNADVLINGGWVTYTSGAVALDANGKLLVRTALTTEQETAIDNGETFKLVATNTGGTAAEGVATVKDDGTGGYFAADDTDGISTLPLNVVLDDDFIPIAVNNDYTTLEDTTLTNKNLITDDNNVDLLGEQDSNPVDLTSLSLASVNNVAFGSLTSSTNSDYLSSDGWKQLSLQYGAAYLKSDGSFVYTPSPDLFGLESFTYTITNGLRESSEATVTIEVNSVNDVPRITVPDTSSQPLTVAEDFTLSFTGATLISVGDVDGTVTSVNVSVQNGTLNTTLETTGASITSGANS
ncbi:Ig-like domain-containing protein, partial [Zwartia sp.]|uniref:beta strand repeat-containing protein n=1 Tax=Zwartia sp. TaxID=2978004 RepID=UPI002722DB54